MAKRTYRAEDTFAVPQGNHTVTYVKGNLYDIDMNDVPKHNRKSFVLVEIEQATAAPGEKRAVRRKPRPVQEVEEVEEEETEDDE
jgi:hypothetical protein